MENKGESEYFKYLKIKNMKKDVDLKKNRLFYTTYAIIEFSLNIYLIVAYTISIAFARPKIKKIY